MLNDAPLLKGVCAPLPLPLDEAGRFDASAQERLLAWVIQEGAGVHAVLSASGFEAGAELRAQVNEVCHFETNKSQHCAHFAGVSAKNAQDLLSNLEHVLKLGVDMAVLDPMAVEDVPDPGTLFHRHIQPLFEKLGRSLPILLEDSGSERRIRTRDLKQLARLDSLRGAIVTASPKVVANYLKGARHYKARHEFGIFLGDPQLMFRLFRPPSTLLGNLRERWQRLWLSAELPHGVVPLSANLFPKAWRQAWAAAYTGDAERMEAFESVFKSLVFPYHPEACVRAALLAEGVLSSDQCLAGGVRLNDEQRALWLGEYFAAKKELEKLTKDTGSPASSRLLAEATPFVEGAGSEFMGRALEEIKKLVAQGAPKGGAGEGLVEARELILRAEAQGKRLHVTGVGKPEYVAGYVASSFSSTGTPAFFLNATEAGHGASGQVAPGDVVIAISNSGETAELKAAISTVKKNGAQVIGVSGRRESWLGRQSDVFLFAGVESEGDALNMAPRASVLAELLVLSALGVELQQKKNFSASDFRSFHPGGELGRRN